MRRAVVAVLNVLAVIVASALLAIVLTGLSTHCPTDQVWCFGAVLALPRRAAGDLKRWLQRLPRRVLTFPAYAWRRLDLAIKLRGAQSDLRWHEHELARLPGQIEVDRAYIAALRGQQVSLVADRRAL